MSFGEYFQAFGSLGDAYREGAERAELKKYQQDAADLAGKQLDAYLGQQGSQPQAGGALAPLGAAAPRRSFMPGASGAGGFDGYLATLRGKESGGNANARNPTSTATGLDQFTASTWAGLSRKYPELGLTPDGRTDPEQSTRAMQAFTKDNADALSRAGVPITPGNLYVSHFLGEAGGPRFITGATQNPDAPAVNFVTPGAASANRTIFYNRDGSPKSAGEVYAERTSRFGGSMDAAAPARVASASPALPTNLPPGSSGLNPGLVPAARPAAPPMASLVGQPPPAEMGVEGNLLQAPMRVAGGPAAAVPPQARPPQVLIPKSMAGAGIPGTILDRGTPVAQVAAPGAAPTPVAPQQTASAGDPEADMPAVGARPAGFQIPGERPAPAPSDFVPGQQVSPAIQTGRPQDAISVQGQPRITQQQAAFLRAQLANPLTRAQAIQTIQGLNAPEKWELKEFNGRVVQTNSRGDYRTVPGFDKPDELERYAGKDGAEYIWNKKTGAQFQVRQAPEITPDTTDIQNYNFAVKNGYQGPFNEWLTNVKRAAASTVSIDQKGESAFATSAGSKLADRFDSIAKDGDAARGDLAMLGQLRGLGDLIGTGPQAAIQQRLGEYGIKLGPSAGPIEAYGSLVDKLVPAQRIPGSGTTSDFDAKGFKASLPRLMNSPEGNNLILGTLEALAQDRVARAAIAEQGLLGKDRGGLDVAETMRQLRALPSPNVTFRSGLSELQKAGKLGAQQQQQARQDAPPITAQQPVAPRAALQQQAPTVAVPPAAVDHLRANPGLRDAFDAKYGPGTADRALGGGRPSGGVL